jgi:tryptophanyl-tRNA synthetase
VGEDQKQHLELARDLAGLFNREYNAECFPLPEPMILGNATRVMSLRDGSSKMSKSDTSDYSRIHLMDDADTLALKIRKAKSDMDPLPDTPVGLASRPEAKNLVTIFSALSGQSEAQICTQFAGQNFAPFKQALTEVLVEKITPIGSTMTRLLKDPQELDRILKTGADRARTIAAKTLADVRDAIGMLPSQ